MVDSRVTFGRLASSILSVMLSAILPVTLPAMLPPCLGIPVANYAKKSQKKAISVDEARKEARSSLT